MIGKLIILLIVVQSVMLQPIHTTAEGDQQQEANAKRVEKRSVIDDETSNLFSIQAVNAGDEVEDLEVAETHVFRPLFSYKQQLLKEQFRNKNRKQVS